MSGTIQAPVNWAKEHFKCGLDPAYLCHSYGIIDNTESGNHSGLMPFELWGYQVEMMEKLVSERFIITLKARQLGMSWVCCAYALWLCLFADNRKVLIMSMGAPEADEMVLRIKNLYNRLPAELRALCPQLLKDNTSVLEWSNGSRVKSVAATEDAGSGGTNDLVILDEFAKMRFPDKTFTAVKPTVDAGGQMVVISTAKGVGNKYHELWSDAESGKNEFHPFFLAWHVRPGRDQAWYNRVASSQKDLDKHKQEYPATAKEAFLASGRARFPSQWLENNENGYGHKANIEAPEFSTLLGHYRPDIPSDLATLPDLRIYRTPQFGHKYLVTADPAQGLPSSDPSPVMVWDIDNWEEVALLYGRYDPTDLGGFAASLGGYYNSAWINVARLNHGGTTLAALAALGYPYVAFGPDKQAGWLETKKSKPRAVDDLAVALRDKDIIIHTEEALAEIEIYQVNDNGSTSAPVGKHDDLVTTCWLFCAWMNQLQPEMRGYAPGAQEIARPAGRVWNANGAVSGYDNSRSAHSLVPSDGRRFSLFGK